MEREKYYSPKVYGLRCPIDQKIVYVGVTKRYLSERLWRHLNPTKKDKSKKVQWIDHLKSQGLSPTIHLLERVEDNDPDRAEAEWIEILCPVYNSNKGGNAPPNMAGWNKKEVPDQVIKELGTLPDYKLAKKYNLSRDVISRRRRLLGIPSYAEQTGHDGKFTRSRSHSL